MRQIDEFGVDLIGPTLRQGRWQEQENKGFGQSNFLIDWTKQQAICPAGKTSRNWTAAVDAVNNEVIKIRFSSTYCGTCSFQSQCTHSNPPRRTLTVRLKAQYEALKAAREREKTASFKHEYDNRAGIEGTISQGVRRCGMRRARYRGLAKTHLQHVFTACAINMVRVMSWLSGERPSRTRDSAFVKLQTQAAA